MKGYKQIIEYVIPFLEVYVQPFSCKKREYELFKTIVLNLSQGNLKNKETLIINNLKKRENNYQGLINRIYLDINSSNKLL